MIFGMLAAAIRGEDIMGRLCRATLCYKAGTVRTGGLAVEDGEEREGREG